MAASNKRIAKNTILLYIRMIFTMLVNLYTSRVVLVVLGAQDFGIYGVVGGVVALFSFLNATISAGTSRFIIFELGKGDFEQLHKTFFASLLNHVFISALILLLAESIGLYFIINKLIIPSDRMNSALIVYQISIFTVLLSFLHIPYNAVIIAHEKMNVFAGISIISVCLKLLCVLSIKYMIIYDSLIYYAILMLICSFITTIMYLFYCWRKFIECRNFVFGGLVMHKKLLVYAAWDLFGNFSGIAQGQGLNILLNLFFGPIVNAAKGISVQVEGLFNQLVSNFMMSVRPQIIKLYAEGNSNAMLKLAYSSAKYGFALTFLVSMPIFWGMDYILDIWLVDIPNYATNFCKIVVLINLVNPLRRPFIDVFHALGRIKSFSLVSGPILILTLPLSYITLRMGYPPESVFFVTLVINIIVQFIDIYVLKRYIEIKWGDYFRFTYLPSVLHIIFVGTPLYFIYRGISLSLLSLFIMCICSLFLSLISVYFLLASKETKIKLKEKINKFRKKFSNFLFLKQYNKNNI